MMDARRPLSAIQQRLYDHLVRAAAAGQLCPTNNELAERAGLLGASTASTAISEIERKGWIAIERGNCARVVTILETAQSTAGAVPAPHWRVREREQGRERRRRTYQRVHSGPPEARPISDDDIRARVERDQAALLATRERHLDEEQRRYGLPTRGRLIDGMPA